MNHSKRAFVSKPIGGEFGISVELNRLADVIDYEEGNIELSHGYPRFVPHREVKLREVAAAKDTGLPFALAFPSKAQATYILQDFLARHHHGYSAQNQGIESSDKDGLSMICLKNKDDYDKLVVLRRTWGSGFDVHDLAGAAPVADQDFSADCLSKDLCALEGERGIGSLMFQSGMAAISSIALATIAMNRRLILIGPAYVDTGTIANWNGELPGFDCCWLAENFHIEALEQELKKGPSLILCEVPTNPRLTLPDVSKISDLARRYDAFLAADATIATPFNFKALDHGFDLVMHSTSKFLNGKYDHLGGTIVAASQELLITLKKIRSSLEFDMCENQQQILHKNLKGFETRMKTINQNASIICERLEQSSLVGEIFYPGSSSPEQEELSSALLSPGRGGLISFVLKDRSRKALRELYDGMEPPVMKGPGLGGETTLVCPYVMLAHYRADSLFLTQQKLDLHLVRISVGTEPVENIWKGLGLE